MSTRSQIFVTGTKPIFYRHYDGYPDTEHGVLATLVPIAAAFKSERGFWDPEYLMARIVHRMIQQISPEDCTGFGLGTDIHCDIEYLYVVTPNKVRVYTPSGDPTWDPTWDGEKLWGVRHVKSIAY